MHKKIMLFGLFLGLSNFWALESMCILPSGFVLHKPIQLGNGLLLHKPTVQRDVPFSFDSPKSAADMMSPAKSVNPVVDEFEQKLLANHDPKLVSFWLCQLTNQKMITEILEREKNIAAIKENCRKQCPDEKTFNLEWTRSLRRILDRPYCVKKGQPLKNPHLLGAARRELATFNNLGSSWNSNSKKSVITTINVGKE